MIKPKESQLNPFNLKFSSDDIEKAFWIDNAHHSLKLIRFSLMLGFVLYGLFGTLDRWVVPEAANQILTIRIIVCASLLLSYIYTFADAFKRSMQLTIGIVTIIAGAGIVAMVLVAHQEGGYHYYAGLLLVFFWTHAMLRQRFIWASLETWGMMALYSIVAIGIKSTPALILTNNFFFLISAILTGMVASYSLEYFQKKVFWQTRMLDESRNKLAAENERKTNELESTRRLQLSMLPQSIPNHPAVELAVSMQTATEVGGDYYDFHESDDNMLTLAIGDATGHGAVAGAMVTAAKILFTSQASDDNLVRILEKSNTVIESVGKSNLFMSMAICRLNGLKLQFAGAGMPPALIYRAAGRSVEIVPLHGLPLGSPISLPYTISETVLAQGDTVLLMSDGFPELFNANGDMLGYERAADIFHKAGQSGAKEIIKHFNDSAKNWLNGHPQQDDITFIAMKVK